METKLLISSVLSVLVLVACVAKDGSGADTPSVPSDPEMHSPASTAGTSRLSSASGMRLPGHEKLRTFPSWEAAINQADVADREYLAAVNSRYLGTLEFHSEDEQQKLVQQGFPMPEEWISARHMADEELRRLADAGNIKAQMFFIDRTAERFLPDRATRGLDLDDPTDKALFDDAVQSAVYSSNMLRVTRSPFVAYLLGQYDFATNSGNPPEFMAASLQLAAELGDTRASQISRVYFEQNPGMNTGLISQAYSGMAARAKSD